MNKTPIAITCKWKKRRFSSYRLAIDVTPHVPGISALYWHPGKDEYRIRSVSRHHRFDGVPFVVNGTKFTPTLRGRFGRLFIGYAKTN